MNRIQSILGLGACALAMACSATVATTSPEPAPTVSSSTLVVDWSIDGTKDANTCFQSSAASIEVTVLDDSGSSAGTFQQDCTAFATSISLAPGSYTASALLLDGGGNARTTAVPINGFVLRGNDTLSIPIDFPASSFF